jgi:hypothetical protein
MEAVFEFCFGRGVAVVVIEPGGAGLVVLLGDVILDDVNLEVVFETSDDVGEVV